MRESERDKGIRQTHLFWGLTSAARTALSGDVDVLRGSRGVSDAALKEDRYLKGWWQEQRSNTGEKSLGMGMMEVMEGYV